MQRTWQRLPGPGAAERQLARAFGLHPLVALLLTHRQVTTPAAVEQFLRSPLDQLANPFLLKGLPEAVNLIRLTVANREPILVYGDYDVDGLTSTALLIRVLTGLKASVSAHIPNRIEDGYGLHAEAIQRAQGQGIKLLITVDCGITAQEEIVLAQRLGMRVIIIDHHHPLRDQVPPAEAIINPKQAGCRYPNKHLSSVGLAFKLAQGLCDGALEPVVEHLDLVGLGTIADLVPLIGENRILVKRGLERLSQSTKPGVRALIEVARIAKPWLDATDVSHALGPRINASGRINTPEPALRLLLTDDPDEGRACARLLHRDNATRQRLERQMFREALAKVEREVNFAAHRAIVIADEGWHPGIAGTIAHRLTERFYRPAFVLAIRGEWAQGSGRSIGALHLVEALERVRHLTHRYGGHQAACGVTIHRAKLEAFTEALNDVIRGELREEDLVPSLAIDADAPLGALAPELLRQIDDLAPFGVGNPRPILVSRGLRVRSSPRFIGQEGLRMWVTDGRLTCEAVGMRLGHVGLSRQFRRPIDVAYSPRLVEREGRASVVLDLVDLRESESEPSGPHEQGHVVRAGSALPTHALVTSPDLMH